MNEISRALARAFASLAHPHMIWLMVWPVLVSLAIWSILAFLFGATLQANAIEYLSGFTLYQRAAEWSAVPMIAKSLAWVLLALLFIPLVLITAVLIISIVSMPMMVRHVAARDFPALERRGGGMVGGVVNAMVALAWLALLALVTLPLWLLPPAWLILPVLLVGYMNQRLFRYDALAEHANRDELKKIVRERSGALWVLGMLVAVAGYVPFLGFFLPVIGGLAFIHYCLARLAELRAASAAAIPPGAPGMVTG